MKQYLIQVFEEGEKEFLSALQINKIQEVNDVKVEKEAPRKRATFPSI